MPMRHHSILKMDCLHQVESLLVVFLLLQNVNFVSRVGGERGTVTSLDLLASCKWYRWIVLFSPPLSEPCLHLWAHTATHSKVWRQTTDFAFSGNSFD